MAKPSRVSEGLGAPYRFWFEGQYRIVGAENFIRLWSPDPEIFTRACSVLQTLRGTLAEDSAGARHRTRLLNNGASWAGVITRPKDAPRWQDPDRERFRNGLRRYSGPGGAGEIVVLEDGMTVQPAAWSPVEIQSHESRKQNSEVIVATHQIPLPMAGILDHATFCNVKEQHKHLYQDTLGPITKQIELAFRLQLLEEYGMFDSHYFEFNVNEKLQGAFEEQATRQQLRGPRPVDDAERNAPAQQPAGAPQRRRALSAGRIRHPDARDRRSRGGRGAAGRSGDALMETDFRAWLRGHIWALDLVGLDFYAPAWMEALAAEPTNAQWATAVLARTRAQPPGEPEPFTGPVAHVPIFGVLSGRASLMQHLFGGTALSSLRAALAQAIQTPSVRSILLEVDSPGGSVYQTSETWRAIKAADAIKPVTAVVTGCGASAAYWLASAARTHHCHALGGSRRRRRLRRPCRSHRRSTPPRASRTP